MGIVTGRTGGEGASEEKMRGGGGEWGTEFSYLGSLESAIDNSFRKMVVDRWGVAKGYA